MTVGTFVQPDHETQTATEYKTNIDNCIAVTGAMGGMFAPHEAATPNMTVVVDAGRLMSGDTLTLVSQQTSSTITAPTTYPRIDRIVQDAQSGSISVVTGTEAQNPEPPAIPSGKLPICQIYLAVGTTAITNNMITDERVPASAGKPGGSKLVRYTTSGNYNWDRPSWCKSVFVWVTGGGGGGGGEYNGTQGGGGGAGGSACKLVSDITGVSSVSVTVGAGGAGSDANGSAGGSSSFGSYCSANGGAGAAHTTGGAGGTGQTGDYLYKGNNGQDGADGGKGGDNLWGLFLGFGGAAGNTGNPGTYVGGGGGGAIQDGRKGGNGAPGGVFIWMFSE